MQVLLVLAARLPAQRHHHHLVLPEEDPAQKQQEEENVSPGAQPLGHPPPCTTPCPPAVLPGVPHILQLVVPHVGHGEDEDVLVGVHTAPQLRGSCYRDGHGHGERGQRGGEGEGRGARARARLTSAISACLASSPLRGVRVRDTAGAERRERQGGMGMETGMKDGKGEGRGEHRGDGDGEGNEMGKESRDGEGDGIGQE